MITSTLTFLAFLALINAGVFYITKKYPLKLYKYLPPIIIVFLIVVLCHTFGVWDISNPAIKAGRTGFLNTAIPFMIFCICLQSDIRKIIKIGPRMLGTMLFGSLSICIGMVVTCVLLAKPLGLEQIPESFGTWTASFTGGIENLYAVASAVNLSEDGLANVLMLINLVFRPWMTVLIVVVVAVATRYDKWVKADLTKVTEISAKFDTGANGPGKGMPTQIDLLAVVGIGFCLVGVAKWAGPQLATLVPGVPAEVWLYIIVTLVSLLLGTFTKLGETNGLTLIGGTLAVYSLSVSSSNMNLKDFTNIGLFFLSGLLVLTLHTLGMLIYGKLTKTDLRTMGIASIANIGGVSSAPVVASVYGQEYQAISVIMASLGSILGTFIGLGMCSLLKLIA